MIDLSKYRVLTLSLNKLPFEVMFTGEKEYEFRKPTKWILDRVVDKKTGEWKPYDYVKFVNGYGNHRPYFIAEFEDVGIGTTLELYDDSSITYSNGLVVELETGIIVIQLGKVVETGNLHLLKK